MKAVKIIGSFLWHTHIYFFILGLVIWYPNNTNQLMGYLAMFIAASYITILLLLLFRAGLRGIELWLPLVLYLTAGWLLIEYFYLSGRTDLYWLGVYAAGFAVIETGKHLYYNHNFLSPIHTHKFGMIGYLLGTVVVISVWFFITEFLSIKVGDVQLQIFLLIYVGIEIFVRGLFVLNKHHWLSKKIANAFIYFLPADL